jgi:hypothetical protein
MSDDCTFTWFAPRHGSIELCALLEGHDEPHRSATNVAYDRRDYPDRPWTKEEVEEVANALKQGGYGS